MRRLWGFCLILALLCLGGCRTAEREAPLPDAAEAAVLLPEMAEEPSRRIGLTAGEATVYETQVVGDEGALYCRSYAFPNGDFLVMGRAEIENTAAVLYRWTAAEDGVVRYYDGEAAQWMEQPFSDCKLRTSLIEVELDGGGTWLAYLPKTYARRENAVLEYFPAADGWLQIEAVDGGWIFSILGTAPGEACVCDYTVVSSREPLLDWSHPSCGSLWSGYTMTGSGKWCFDGYYWPVPENYRPAGENYLYRCPASYLTKSLAYAATVHRGAEDLTIAMLDTLSQAQNPAGFWETSPESGWLSEDYGIGPGFYDTRFNTDLMEIYVSVYTRLGGDRFLETMERYADFYLDFAETHHMETENGGWLVQDYCHPDGNDPTHCSLNHLAAECIALYHLSDTMAREDLERLADRLLQAIRDTAPNWINEEGNLHYSVSPDGTYGAADYPYLTYNDLYRLQAHLLERTGAEDDKIAFLMDAKRQWMEQNGVTGYLK